MGPVSSHGPQIESSPTRSQGPPADTNIQLETELGDMSVAREHALRTSCAYYDEKTKKYMSRPVRKTTLLEIGEYGLGLMLYFDFVKKTGTVLCVMALLSTALLAVNYSGDFAGVTAGIFAKMTIGNIGVCGQYGELCPDVLSYPSRILLEGQDILLRNWTPVFGGLAAGATAIFAIFVIWFYYVYQPRQRKLYDERHITPTDYSVEVDLLPRKLAQDMHHDYDKVLREHFEKVAGKEGSVAEVALAREYHGAIRKFMQIHELTVQIKEAKAKLRRSPNEAKAKSLLKVVRKLEAQRLSCEKAVTEEAFVPEKDRSVCKAFIIFSETYHKRRVVEAYSLSNRGFLLRLIMPSALKLLGKHRIRVRNTCEPENVYHENLDISRTERWLRRSFTVFAAIIILFVAFAVLLLAHTSTRTGTPLGVGAKPVWVIANSSDNTGSCFETCGVNFYSDPLCSVAVESEIIGVFEASGTYSSGSFPAATDTCTLENVWQSDRCAIVEAWTDPWRFVPDTGTSSVATSLVKHVKSRKIERKSRQVSAMIRSKSLGVREPTLKAPASEVLLPDLSPLCSTPSKSCGSTNQCFEPSQQCDGVFNCVSGFDEDFDASGIACNVGCSSNVWSSECPGLGRCVDVSAESCGSDCIPSSSLANSATCIAITDRIDATVSDLRECSGFELITVINSNFGGACPTKFFSDPCCVLEQLSSDEKLSLSSCSAGSVVDDPAATYRGLSALGYMEQYCRSHARFEAQTQNGALTHECDENTVEALLFASPNCYAAMSANRRWCECADDLALLPIGGLDEIEKCQVLNAYYGFFGIQNGFNHVMNLGDVIRQTCSTVGRTLDPVLVDKSPYLVFTTVVNTASVSSEDFVEPLVPLLKTALGTNTAYVQLTAGVIDTSATVRVEITDRSNSSETLNVWNLTVLDAYTALTAELTALYPTRTSDRIQIKFEEHCPDSSLYFQCPVTRKCLDGASQVCDGVPDCEVELEGFKVTQDELNCDIPESETLECAMDEFQCSSGSPKCLPNLFWCDGVRDCADSSDEAGEECDIQKIVRETVNSTSALFDPFMAMEFIGFHFKDSVSVQCITLTQPTHSLSSVLDVYACPGEVVFRGGHGLALRYPDLNCVKVQSAGIRTLTGLPTQEDAVLTPSNMLYSVFPPQRVDCDVNAASNDCPILTGNAFSFCNQGQCEFEVSSATVNISVLTTPVCDLGSPISPAVAETLVQRYTLEDGTVDSDILQELTYTCFCDQQKQYQSALNPLFAYPPYKTDIQLMCATYYNKLIRDQLIGVGGVSLVSVVNILLSTVMYWLADIEKTESLTAKAASELWKLFLAQFVNAGLLVLLVNAKFYDSKLKFAGLGEGQFGDTNKAWYNKVGASLSLSMFLLMFTNTVPFLLWEGIARWLRRRDARKQITQAAMNKALEAPVFMLSLRLAQFNTSLAVTVMYGAPMPVMLWTATLTAFILYWYDKFFFLRCCKKPPMHTDSTMVICLRLMPVVIVANLCFMIWTMSNQEVFPSDHVNKGWSDSLNTGISESSLLLYISGRLSFINDFGSYRRYITGRLADSLRKAPFGGVVVLGLVLLFFVFRFVMFLLSVTVFALFRFIFFSMHKQASKSRRLLALRRTYTNLLGTSSRTEAEPSFDEAKKNMEKTNMLSSYKMHEHPEYRAAYAAINRVKKRHSERMSLKEGASPKVGSPKGGSPKAGSPPPPQAGAQPPKYPSLDDPGLPAVHGLSSDEEVVVPVQISPKSSTRRSRREKK